MDTDKNRRLVERVRLNRARRKITDNYDTVFLSEQLADEDNADDETEFKDGDENTVPEDNDKHEPDNQALIDGLLSLAPRMNLNGSRSSVLMTLVYLLRMDPSKFMSQKDIALNLGLAYSTAERHIKDLRDSGFIETKIITDALGSKMIYSFNGLRQTLQDLGVEI